MRINLMVSMFMKYIKINYEAQEHSMKGNED
jgi:hypothetical protein